MEARRLLDRFRVTVEPSQTNAPVDSQVQFKQPIQQQQLPTCVTCDMDSCGPSEHTLCTWNQAAATGLDSSQQCPAACKKSLFKQRFLQRSNNDNGSRSAVPSVANVTPGPSVVTSGRSTAIVIPSAKLHGVVERRNERFFGVGRTDAFYRGSLIKARFMVDRWPAARSIMKIGDDDYSASCPNLFVHCQLDVDAPSHNSRLLTDLLDVLCISDFNIAIC